MQAQTCSRCGMSKEKWTGNEGKGVEEFGQFFCCSGCANETGCICGKQ